MSQHRRSSEFSFAVHWLNAKVQQTDFYHILQVCHLRNMIYSTSNLLVCLGADCVCVVCLVLHVEPVSCVCLLILVVVGFLMLDTELE